MNEKMCLYCLDSHYGFYSTTACACECHLLSSSSESTGLSGKFRLMGGQIYKVIDDYPPSAYKYIP